MQRLSSEERKKQIVDAALQVIAKKGVSRLTIAEIAKEVGLSEGALFKHFPNKQEIIRSAVDAVQNNLIGEAGRIASLQMPAKEKLKRLLQFHLSFLGKNPGIPRVIFSEQIFLNDDELKKKMAVTMQEYLFTIRTIFKQGVHEGVFREDLDIEMVTISYIGIVQNNAFRWSLSDYTWDIVERWQQIYDYFISIWGVERVK